MDKASLHYIISTQELQNSDVFSVRKNVGYLHTVKLVWTEKNFKNNISRLNITNLLSLKPLYVHFIADKTPDHGFITTGADRLKFGNRNIALLCAEISKDHELLKVSLNAHDFRKETALIFGCKLAEEFNELNFNTTNLEKDLEGADGWDSFDHLFDFLNFTTKYVVLRGFHELLNGEKADDIDFLVEDLSEFVQLINLSPLKFKPYKGRIRFTEATMPVDIRFIGDGYYDSIWEKAILESRIFKNGIYIPEEINYFFSLLYHAEIHKKGRSKKYAAELGKLAEKLNVKNNVNSNTDLLIGFMKWNHYSQPKPIDFSVYEERDRVKFGEIEKGLSPYQHTLSKMKRDRAISRMIPAFIKTALKKIK